MADREGGEREYAYLAGFSSHLAHILSVFAVFNHLLKNCIQMHCSKDFKTHQCIHLLNKIIVLLNKKIRYG